MELNEYNQLPLNEKAVSLWDYGVFVKSVTIENASNNLYSYFGYYVEVRVNKADNNILAIKAFKKGYIMEKYLDGINLLELE